MSNPFDLPTFRLMRDTHQLAEYEARLPVLIARGQQLEGYLARVQSEIARLERVQAELAKQGLKGANHSKHDIEVLEDKATNIWRELAPLISEARIIERELPDLRAAVQSGKGRVYAKTYTAIEEAAHEAAVEQASAGASEDRPTLWPTGVVFPPQSHLLEAEPQRPFPVQKKNKTRRVRKGA